MTVTKLIFEHKPEVWDNCEQTDHWFSGIYKITLYPEHTDNKHRPAYCAYYKPYGWKNWGNRVDQRTQFYLTLKEAQTACQIHSETN